MKTHPAHVFAVLANFAPPFLVALVTGSVLFVTVHSAYVAGGEMSAHRPRAEAASPRVCAKKAPPAQPALAARPDPGQHAKG
jgi:hypothetical protein